MEHRKANIYGEYVRAVAKKYGFTEEGNLILWGKVERHANLGIRDILRGVDYGSKYEVAILLMALKEEEERRA